MANLPDHIVVHLEAQPPPKRGEARPTSHLVVEDMLAKYDAGAMKYGAQHQHDNGRDHIIDAYQEVLDLACYLRAEIEKRKLVTDSLDLHEQFARLKLELAAATEQIGQFVAERGERLRQLERAADENNRLITAQTKAISERDVALADLQVERNACAGLKHRVMTLETMADVPDVMVRLGNANCQRDEALTQLEEARTELAKLKTDAPTPAPAGYVDERDHRRALSQLDAMTKERDGAVHALAAAKSERDMARRSLAEAQHEVEAARKLHTEGGGSHVYVRRIEKALEIVTSITQTPAMKDLRAVLLGEKP